MEALLKVSIFNLIVLLLFSGNLLIAQEEIEDKKIVNEYYQVEPNTTVEIVNKFGNTTIMTSDDMTVNVKVEVSVIGWDKKELLLTLKNVDTDIKEEAGKLSITISSDITKWVTINDKSKIKFSSGESASIEELYIDCIVTMPRSLNLSISSNYNDITLNDIDGNVNVMLISGNLQCGNIGGEFTLDLQYGEAEIQSMNNGELKIFDSDLEMLEATDIILNSQYSDIEIDEVNSIKLDSKDCDYDFRNVKKLSGKDMYSTLEASVINSIDATIYDCDYEIQKVDDLNINSQYSSFDITEINALIGTQINDCDFAFQSINVLNCNSEYSSYDIGLLRNKIELNSNDDEVEINSIAAEIETMVFVGRYTEYELNFEKNVEYSIEAELKYSEIDVPEDKLAISEFVTEDDRIKLKAQTKAKSKTELPLLSFKGNDCEIEIDND